MNVTGGKNLFSNRDDLLPYDTKIISSQFVKVEPDRDISNVGPQSEAKYKLPTLTNSSYELSKHFFRGQVSLVPATGTQINSQSIICLEQCFFSALYNFDLKIGNTTCKAHDCNTGVQPLSQAYWQILTNTAGRPYGTASMTFKQTPTLSGNVTGSTATVGQFQASQQAFSLVTNTCVETNFADICLDVANGKPSVQPRLNGLQGFEAFDIDSGFLYRVRITKIDSFISNVGNTNAYVPVINFIAHAPIPLLKNEYMIQGNIPIEFVLTRNSDYYATIGQPGISVQVNKLDLYVKQNILSSEALMVIQEEPEKIYDFFGAKSAIFPLTSSSGINIKIDFCSKTPSLILFSFIRPSLLNNNLPRAAGGIVSYKSWLRNGFSDTAAISTDDNFTSRRILLTQGYATLNGRNIPESDYLTETNGYINAGGAANPPATGESDAYHHFKQALLRPDSIGYQTAFNNLGIFAIDCVSTDSGYWHSVAQDLTDSQPTLNLSYFQQPDTNVVPITEYAVFVMCITNRKMIISNNQTVSFTSP